jgi:hypothetical protein
MKNKLDNQINFGRILSDKNKPIIFEYSLIYYPIKTYLIKEKMRVPIKAIATKNGEFKSENDSWEKYERMIFLKYSDNYIKVCAENELKSLNLMFEKLQRVYRNENNQEVMIFSATMPWELAQYSIRFIKRNKTDEVSNTLVPGKGSLKEFTNSFNNLKTKLDCGECLDKRDFKGLPIPSEFKFALERKEFSQVSTSSDSSQNSFKSSSSQQSLEENYVAHLANEKKISKIPRRSNSVLSNNSLKSVSSDSTSNTGIPILKGSSLFKREVLKDNTQNLYKINKAESWILISPELLDLVKAKKLIEDTDSRKADALTYRNTDKVRLINLNKNEISILEEKLPEFCKELESKERIHIFGH